MIQSSVYEVSEPQAGDSTRKTATTLLGIGTAVPGHAASQDQILRFSMAALAHQTAVPQGLIRRIYNNSGIAHRYSVIPDYVRSDAAEFTFFPQNWELSPPPGTGRRMDEYEKHSLPLAAEAARKAIAAAGIAPETITHLVISTCTGFFAPGLDVLLVRQLGIPTTAQRTILGFMGCYAGISGLRTCHQIVQSDPAAVVLQVAVELCSLHYQTTPTVETVVSNAIFSDGAAAAIYTGERSAQDAAGAAPLARVAAVHSAISPDSLDRMSWRISDHGFVMTLDAGVPDILQTQAPEFTRELAAAGRLKTEDISGWAIHPGGRKIVEAVQESLGLSPDDVSASTSTLRDFGNMSSAAILFVIQRELARTADPGGYIAAMAFGPGLTMEGALLQRG